MSAVELAVEKVKLLDESRARKLLVWLAKEEQVSSVTPVGAMAMLGFARRFRSEPRSTSQWMSELRDGG